MKPLAFTVLLTASLLPLPAPAQGQLPPEPRPGVRKSALLPTTPIDKMIALDHTLGRGHVDWSAVSNRFQSRIQPNRYRDTAVSIPVLLGIRLSDAILAIQARDPAGVNRATNDIENLAAKLGVENEQLLRARVIRAQAERHQWSHVFLELGFLQRAVLRKFEEDPDHVFGGEGRSLRFNVPSEGWSGGAVPAGIAGMKSA